MSANPQPSLVTIAVNIGSGVGGPTVDKDPVTIDRTQGGDYVEIVWVSSKTFSVTFPNGSPFSQSTFNNANNNSGTITSTASGTYKYNVTVNGQVLDPQVIVRP